MQQTLLTVVLLSTSLFIGAEETPLSNDSTLSIAEKVHFIEKSTTESQKQQFIEQLKRHPEIKTIAEIGLYAGQSAYTHIATVSNVQKLVTFDWNNQPSTALAIEQFKHKYPDAFTFIQGDPLHTLPEYAHLHPELQFDLIYLDGERKYENVVQNIIDARTLAHAQSILWINDYHFPSVERAIKECEALGLIAIRDVHFSTDDSGKRCWIEARYRFH